MYFCNTDRIQKITGQCKIVTKRFIIHYSTKKSIKTQTLITKLQYVPRPAFYDLHFKTYSIKFTVKTAAVIARNEPYNIQCNSENVSGITGWLIGACIFYNL